MLIAESLRLGKIRITGGEPLLRQGLTSLVSQFAKALPETELCLTTNGILLKEHASSLKAAGLHRVNVSLDTTNPETFAALTGGGELSRVKDGIRAAVEASFTRLKINCVLLRRYNRDHLPELAQFALDCGAAIRFIELMPFGQAESVFQIDYMSGLEARHRLSQHFKICGPLSRRGSSTDYLLLDDSRRIRVGFITPVSQPFCSDCNRLRMDNRGYVFACLRSRSGVDLADIIRRKGRQIAKKELLRMFQHKREPQEGWPSRSMVSIGG
jgi:cyclic pyranopterin phosphate synthase